MSRGVASKTVTCIGGMAGGAWSPQADSVIAAVINVGISRIGASLDRAFITSTIPNEDTAAAPDDR